MEEWTCSKCGILLNSKENHYYLEVHHKDRDKMNNNSENLESLCVLCHADEHQKNFSIGLNKVKVIDFLASCEAQIKRVNPGVFKKWKAITMG